MRRFLYVVAVVSVLGLAMAAPVLGAPDKISATWDVTCGSDRFTVQSPGDPPGWAGDAIGTTPSLFMGGHLTLYEEGQAVFSIDNPPPPGLSSQLVTCVIVGPVGFEDDFQWVIDPAYILFTPHA